MNEHESIAVTEPHSTTPIPGPAAGSTQGRRRVFSGIQPSGDMQLGNYLGAIKGWVQRQDEKENFFCVVDLHTLTVPQDPETLRRQTRSLVAIYLASGLHPDRSTLFLQSHVTAHCECTWLLNCVTPLGWLYKMTQFKEKAARQGQLAESQEFLTGIGDRLKLAIGLDEEKRLELLRMLDSEIETYAGGLEGTLSKQESVLAGLLDYPVLMAADILLYDAHEVPVGEDQKQHVELARNIAERFNRLFGETFILPQPVIPTVGARIMGFDNPNVKMSKSYAHIRGHAIRMLDTPEEIERTCKRAVTDTGNEIRFSDDPAKAGVNNLLSIYQVITGRTKEQVEGDFESARGYGDLKKRVAEVIIAELTPIRERYDEFMSDPAELDRLLARGAERARAVADPKLRDVQHKMGLVAPVST